MTVDNLFFFNDTATTEIYTLSLHDALPISEPALLLALVLGLARAAEREDVVLHLDRDVVLGQAGERSEEHTSELQSRQYLVCRLLLEKKKTLLPPSPCSASLAHACHDTLHS